MENMAATKLNVSKTIFFEYFKVFCGLFSVVPLQHILNNDIPIFMMLT